MVGRKLWLTDGKANYTMNVYRRLKDTFGGIKYWRINFNLPNSPKFPPARLYGKEFVSTSHLTLSHCIFGYSNYFTSVQMVDFTNFCHILGTQYGNYGNYINLLRSPFSPSTCSTTPASS